MTASILTTTALAALAAVALAGCSDDDTDSSTDPGSDPGDDVGGAPDAGAPGPDAGDLPTISAEEIAELEAHADQVVAAGIPGVVVVVREGAQTVRIARGVSDLATGAALPVDARFRVASIAKSVLSSVLLQLEGEGVVDLSDTVDHWLPGLVAGNHHATLEQLIRLESGIPDYSVDPRHMEPYYAGDFDHAWTPEQLVALANQQETQFAPGEGWSYSNTNYAILALVIEKATGKLLADVVHDRIFAPLGMNHSAIVTTGAIDDPFAHGYMIGLGPDPLDVTAINPSSIYGAGNLVATAGDLVTFYAALAAGRVVPAATLARMITIDPHLPDTRYAMGLWRFENQFGCGTYYGHDGGAPGYMTTAYTRIDGKRQYAITISSMTVDEHAGDAAAQAAFLGLNHAASCRQPQP